MTNGSEHDVVVIGSGFGGAAAAHELVRAGRRVVLIERGGWVPRSPRNWAPDGAGYLTPHYTMESPYQVVEGGHEELTGAYTCVGGSSVFFGCVLLRLRPADFAPDPEIANGSGARWPIGYNDLVPYYDRAEQLLNVAGEVGRDPTEPPAHPGYPQPPPPLSEASLSVAAAAESLGLRPFHLPLAINFRDDRPRQERCISCTTCDAHACAIHAKNDVATTIIPDLLERGLRLRSNTVATRLVVEGARVAGVECVDRLSGEHTLVRGRQVVLAAGALATPHLLLASDLARRSPAGDLVGRFLMRHYNAIPFGVFWRPPNPRQQYHKQLGIHDYYYGHPSVAYPKGKLGAIQEELTPSTGLVKATLPWPLGHLMSPLVSRCMGLLVMAEDQPQRDNRVWLDPENRDRFGMPRLVIRHRYSRRDRAAGHALVAVAKRILRRAGAFHVHVHQILTFSHAVGTVRMGPDPATAPLDRNGRFHGLDNLFVADGSVFPTAGGVNPSLTIAALGLRLGHHLASV